MERNILESISLSLSTIENDLNEIIKLDKEFLDLSSSIPCREATEIRCRTIHEYCPNEEENLYTILSESQFNEKSLSNGTKIFHSSSSCMSRLHQLIQFMKNILKFLEIIQIV